MKTGDVINGYVVLSSPTTAGGGRCSWAFAHKGGNEYFLKEFLSPTYPTADSPGSPSTKAEKLKRCELFERHHDQLRRAVATKCGEGGNLVFTIDFFRYGSKYYKVTEKINVSSMKIVDISCLPLESRLLILKTVAHSLNVLHKLNIVHGDLKPDNILIKQTETGSYIAKLIDFDNSYFSGEHPIYDCGSECEEIVGDLVYFSPETVRFIKSYKGASRDDLNLSVDIFALGLVYCQYLTGELPEMEEKYRYPFESVNDGKTIKVRLVEAPERLTELINAMLDPIQTNRPTVSMVFDALKNLDYSSSVIHGKAETAKCTGVLSGTLIETRKLSKPESSDEDRVVRVTKNPSKLRGTLIKKE